MKIGVIKETKEYEKRVALTPDVCKTLIGKGFECLVEDGAGTASFLPNQSYSDAGATITDKKTISTSCDIVLKVNPFTKEEIDGLDKKATCISLMYAQTQPDMIAAIAAKGCSAFSVDAIPRISRAQKMDVLSSQANLAGYKSVIIGAYHLGKIFPLLMTAAGTIKPAKVVIMGAGVAGLQAIATAKRLGAIVEVSDIRPETKEQVESLGGRFIEMPKDDSVKLEGGYVKGVSDDFLKKQQEVLNKHFSEADLVITTALIPGRKAPVLISEEQVSKMKNGAVILDMAVEQGGNCACSEYGKIVVKNGVTIVGEPNIPSMLPLNASDLFAKNVLDFITHLATKDGFKWELDEEITKGSLMVHNGKVVHSSLVQVAK
ncbi:MAG: Re/Si-specific NAD(P)(+) transhydrogenase subunit alpha [Chitinophagales bacterium]|jgi:NAD(P) transhydrogenase subunit alpha|nr:Re/Si-specific NAD(P)(+) transhydrogenase subunit alpha [Sphingobacteriales bacterium]